MPSERIISGREFMSDIRSGLTARELIDKYDLSEKELEALFNQLASAGGKPLKLYGRSGDKAPPVDTVKIRFSPRLKVPWTVSVVDSRDPHIRGELVDLTEHGIGVKGIDTYAGDVRNLTIETGGHLPVQSISLRATCMWVASIGSEGEPSAGFRIDRISKDGLRDLRKLIGAVMVPEIELDPGRDAGTTTSSEWATIEEDFTWTCPFCRAELPEEPEECPKCGIIVAEYQGAVDGGKLRT